MGCKIIVKNQENILRLLIVEDEKQICDMVAKSLYAAGYEVDTCYDGKEALECILSENYDLIVLDLNLFLRENGNKIRLFFICNKFVI